MVKVDFTKSKIGKCSRRERSPGGAHFVQTRGTHTRARRGAVTVVSVRRTHQVTHPKPEHKAMRIHLLDGQIHSGTDITIAPDLAQKSLSLYQSLPTLRLCL